jgi:hypothetical protein
MAGIAAEYDQIAGVRQAPAVKEIFRIVHEPRGHGQPYTGKYRTQLAAEIAAEEINGQQEVRLERHDLRQKRPHDPRPAFGSGRDFEHVMLYSGPLHGLLQLALEHIVELENQRPGPAANFEYRAHSLKLDSLLSFSR